MIADPRPIAGGDGTLGKEQIDNIVSAHGAGIRRPLEGEVHTAFRSMALTCTMIPKKGPYTIPQCSRQC